MQVVLRDGAVSSKSEATCHVMSYLGISYHFISYHVKGIRAHNLTDHKDRTKNTDCEEDQRKNSPTCDTQCRVHKGAIQIHTRTCFASSLVGAMTSTRGRRPGLSPSAPSARSFSITGTAKARVLPMPVRARPIRSLPLLMCSYVCACRSVEVGQPTRPAVIIDNYQQQTNGLKRLNT